MDELEPDDAADKANTEANKGYQDKGEEQRIAGDLCGKIADPTDCSGNNGVDITNDSCDSSSGSLDKHILSLSINMYNADGQLDHKKKNNETYKIFNRFRK